MFPNLLLSLNRSLTSTPPLFDWWIAIVRGKLCYLCLLERVKPISIIKRVCCSNCYKSDLFQSRIFFNYFVLDCRTFVFIFSLSMTKNWNQEVFTPSCVEITERSMFFTSSLNLLLSTAQAFSFRIYAILHFKTF